MQTGTRVLGDRYELISLLATGGMGQVWRGRDTLLQRPVAVKVLRSEFTGDPAFLTRFRSEAQHTALLSHPNIASVFDYGEVPASDSGERLAYLVMELVEGETLSALLAREGRLDLPRTLDVLRQTAAALAAAHAAGVVHRDVKPGNVLLGPAGVVKITDFGIAWSASSAPLTQTGQVIGTAHYLSPEQAQGGKAGPASDVYALGAVAYECLAGRRAMDGESFVQIVLKKIHEDPEPLPSDVPADVRALVERAMAKDPADRFPDGAALLQAVDDVLAGRPPRTADRTGTAVMPLPAATAEEARADRTTVAAPPARPVTDGLRRRRRFTAGGVVGLLLVLAAIALVTAGLLGVGETSSPPAGATGTAAPSTAPVPAATGVVPTTPVAPPPTPPTFDLAAGDYVGRPVDEVTEELTDLGLQVRSSPAETTEAEAGTVTGVDPLTGLLAGQQVSVTYAVAPPSPVEVDEDKRNEEKQDEEKQDEDKQDEERGSGDGQGNGRGKD